MLKFAVDVTEVVLFLYKLIAVIKATEDD